MGLGLPESVDNGLSLCVKDMKSGCITDNLDILLSCHHSACPTQAGYGIGCSFYFLFFIDTSRLGWEIGTQDRKEEDKKVVRKGRYFFTVGILGCWATGMPGFVGTKRPKNKRTSQCVVVFVVQG